MTFMGVMNQLMEWAVISIYISCRMINAGCLVDQADLRVLKCPI